MSKSPEANPSHQKEGVFKSESSTKNDSEEKQKCLQKMLRDLFSPSESTTPTGQLKAVDTLLDDRIGDKPILKIHVSKNINSDIKNDKKTNTDKNKNEKELDSLPRCFIRKKDGTLIEHEYTPQPPAK